VHPTQPMSVTVTPQPMTWARYEISGDGEFIPHGDRPAGPREIAIIAAALNPANTTDGRTPSRYRDAAAARAAAASLLGYAHQFGTTESLPESFSTTPLAPTARTATTTRWDLGTGLALRYAVPFTATLTATPAQWELTADLATRWAQALLALAIELDHAHALAAGAVVAERTATTTTDIIGLWLNSLRHDLSPRQAQLVAHLRRLLTAQKRDEPLATLCAALDRAHPDLPGSLTDLRLMSGDTLTHRDAAAVIAHLADLYALPIAFWTADSPYLQAEITGDPLTEREWQRLGNSTEMGNFEPMIDNEQANGTTAIDVQLALHQAGILCRDCDNRISGEIAVTLGRCPSCRPDDPTEAVNAGCLGDNGLHTPGGPDNACHDCGVPLPANYFLVLETERAEQHRRDAARRAAEQTNRQIMALVQQFIGQDHEQMITAMDSHSDHPTAQPLLLDSIRAAARNLSPDTVIAVLFGYARRAGQLLDTNSEPVGDPAINGQD
jgi:hypothetical protein